MQCAHSSPLSATCEPARAALVVALVPGERVYRLLQRVLNVAAERWGVAEIHINQRIASKRYVRG